MKKTIITLAVSMCFPAIAQANNCAEVIKLSLTTSSVVQSRDQFETDAREFCSSYSRNTASGNAAGANVGYGGFTFGGTSSSTNAKAVARNVCESTDSGNMRADAYDRLIQEIAPQAYSSYDNCINQQSSVNIEIGAGNTPSFVPVTINFVPQTAGQFAEIAVITDDTVDCGMDEPRRMNSAGSFIIACRREDVTRIGSINVIDQAGGGGNLSVPWTAYTGPSGIPVNIAQQFAQATQRMNEMVSAFQGSVVAFESNACPAGFSPFEPAQGRLIRGLDLSGAIDPGRELGSVQEDQFASHTHRAQHHPNTRRASRTGNERACFSRWCRCGKLWREISAVLQRRSGRRRCTSL